jgi:FkbM family methyltransferase
MRNSIAVVIQSGRSLKALVRLSRKLWCYLSLLGFARGTRWLILRVGDRFRIISGERRVRPPGVEHPVTMRVGGSSDPLVFDQIFINGDLANLIGRVREARTIVDLGANVGYASIVFLKAFPNAHVLAVEPDPKNAALCSRNLAPYGNRTRLVQAAAWSRSCDLVLIRGAFGDGKEWATQVRPAQPGEVADVKALDMPTLFQMCPLPVIDILKIDIEEAESTLFGEGTERWLNCVRNLCVEIHSKAAASVIERALSGFQFECLQSGEYKVYLNLIPKTQCPPLAANMGHGADRSSWTLQMGAPS